MMKVVADNKTIIFNDILLKRLDRIRLICTSPPPSVKDAVEDFLGMYLTC